MTSLIVDASVAAKWLLTEADSDKAASLFRAWTDRRITLLAPTILPAEVANALWKRAVRGLVPASDALRLHREFRDLDIPLHPIAELVDEALDLALRFRHSVYDGLYLALGRQVGAVFVTADEKLLRTAKPGSTCLLRDWRL